MTTIKKTAVALLTSLGVLCGARGAAAQMMVDDSEEYQSELKPGMHIYVDSSKESMLMEAAREGKALVISGQAVEKEPEPQTKNYTVKEGDTLWDICTSKLGDPYVWPRIWSYNPEITNPHWIYPGEVLWLSPREIAVGGAAEYATGAMERPEEQLTSHVPRAILIRNRGFVDEEILNQSGTITGSNNLRALLATFDEAYVQFDEDAEVRPGDEYATFEIIGPVAGHDDPGSEIGKLVEITGQVRVTRFNPETHLARVVIDDAIKSIERGTMVGPVKRRFELVPAVPNERDLTGNIITFMDHPRDLAAAHVLVFVDLGSEDGVRMGNRLFAVEQRDNYLDSVDRDDDPELHPEEVVAELRVVEARPHTSTCLVTASTRELEHGERVEMRKGY